MLWELSVTEQRYRAVLEVRAGVPVTQVAERYGVSRQSVHAWLCRYRDEGPSGLADRSHKVNHHPWQIPARGGVAEHFRTGRSAAEQQRRANRDLPADPVAGRSRLVAVSSGLSPGRARW